LRHRSPPPRTDPAAKGDAFARLESLLGGSSRGAGAALSAATDDELFALIDTELGLDRDL
jgi:hypothetical protein